MKNIRTIRGILYLNTHDSDYPIPFGDILYCSADGSYTNIFCNNGKRYMASRKIGQIEKELTHECFFRCHKSFIINLYFVSHLEKKINHTRAAKVVLMNGVRVNCAYNNKKAFRKKLQYIKAHYDSSI